MNDSVAVLSIAAIMQQYGVNVFQALMIQREQHCLQFMLGLAEEDAADKPLIVEAPPR